MTQTHRLAERPDREPDWIHDGTGMPDTLVIEAVEEAPYGEICVEAGRDEMDPDRAWQARIWWEA